MGTTLPPNGVFALFFEDKMRKDPWLFWRGGWKLRCEFLGSLSQARARASSETPEALSQARASSETPEALSQTRTRTVVCGLSGTSKPPKTICCFARGGLLNRTYYKGPVTRGVVVGGGAWTNNGSFVIGF